MAELEGEQQYLSLVNAADALFQEQEYEGAIAKYDEALQIKKEFSVLSRRNKCVEYLDVKKKLLAKNQSFIKPDIIPPAPLHKEKEPEEKKNTVIVFPKKEIKKNIIAEPVESGEKKWYMAMVIHLLLFGFGLFYVSPAAKRKWLYPACVFLSSFILIALKQRWIADEAQFVYRLVFLAGSVTGYLMGLLDCLITLIKKTPPEKITIPGMADEQSVAMARTWIYVLCVTWMLQYLLLAYAVYSRRGYFFDCDRCVPSIDIATYFVFLVITPVFIFLLLRKSRWGWMLAMAASVLKIVTVPVYFIETYLSPHTTHAEGLMSLLFMMPFHILLIYILQRPSVKVYYRITEKLVNQVVLWSASVGILYFIIVLLTLLKTIY